MKNASDPKTVLRYTARWKWWEEYICCSITVRENKFSYACEIKMNDVLLYTCNVICFLTPLSMSSPLSSLLLLLGMFYCRACSLRETLSLQDFSLTVGTWPSRRRTWFSEWHAQRSPRLAYAFHVWWGSVSKSSMGGSRGGGHVLCLERYSTAISGVRGGSPVGSITLRFVRSMIRVARSVSPYHCRHNLYRPFNHMLMIVVDSWERIILS